MAFTEERAREIMQEMITASNAAVQAQVGTILSGVKQEITQELANQIAKADDLAQKLVANAEAVTTASHDAHQRIDSQVVQANERSQQTFVEFERLRLQLGEKFDEIDGKHSDLMQRLAAFDQEIAEKQSATVVKLESSYSELVVKLQEEFANTKRYIDHVEKRITESGMTGGMGTGSENKRNKLTVKDCPVSRMSEKPDILDFRQWITTVERQLESAFGYTGIDVELQKLRFCKEKLCREDFDSIIFQLNADSECSVTDGMQWNFDDSTRFIYNYIIGQLNQTMFERVQNVVDHNGWEVMRLVLEKADKPPDNAVFTMNLCLSKLVIDKDGKELVCKGLKDLMAFIKTVDDASTQFQRNTGQKPDPGRLKEILWQVTDPATRIELGRLGFDGDSKSYEETCKEIKKSATICITLPKSSLRRLVMIRWMFRPLVPRLSLVMCHRRHLQHLSPQRPSNCRARNMINRPSTPSARAKAKAIAMCATDAAEKGTSLVTALPPLTPQIRSRARAVEVKVTESPRALQRIPT